MSRIKHACSYIRIRFQSAPPWRASRCIFGHARPAQGAKSPEPPSRLQSRRLAQGMVEFALALPILLLLVFGIIEFARLLQAWLALENGARFGVRYAVTGSFNPLYCARAGIALNLQSDDMLDGAADCRVPERYPSGANAGQLVPHAEEESNRLQDWARLPSVRDTAISGATGIAWDNRTTASGDYLNFLTHAFSDKQTCTDAGGNTVPCPDYRGNPGAKGYFAISVCSNRANAIDDYNPYNDDGDGFRFNANPFYFNPNPPNPLPTDPNQLDLLRFPVYCEEVNQSSAVARYIDDPGGPGDRVRVVLTYRHTLITPFVSNWWPTLRLIAEREGIVEKYRTSRVTGLSGAVAQAATWTYTPLPPTETSTPTVTLTPTITHSPTVTFTPTRSLTPTTTATPYCGAVTFGAPSDPNLDLDTGGPGIWVYINNNSSLPAVLTGESINWQNDWHTIPADIRNQNVNVAFGWYDGSLNTFWWMPSGSYAVMTGAPMSWDRNFATTYAIQPNSSGQLYAWFNSNFEQTSFTAPRQPTDAFNYYHGRDFIVTVRYTLGGLACQGTVTGYQGPQINPLAAIGGGAISLNARATGWDGLSSSFRADALNLVTFTVFDTGGSMVHYQREGRAPWCLFGEDGTNCYSRRVYVDRWSNGAIITPGNYTIHIITRDKSDAQYATHVIFNLVIPLSTIPTAAATSTMTPLPLPTFTSTATDTPTATPTQLPTALPTNTPTPVNTVVPVSTNTRPPSATPTICTTPIEMGGCP